MCPDENIFTQFYSTPFIDKQKKEPTNLTSIQAELKKYTHADALNFADATDTYGVCSNHRNPVLKRDDSYSIQQFETESGIRAYYRVALAKKNSYVLAACHVNVHGLRRGDLRFIEVNDRTVTRGTEQFSVMGKLYLGDMLVVKELAKLKHPTTYDVFETTLDQECTWMASKITVLPRMILDKVQLSVLNPNDDVAVVKEQSELMTLPDGLTLKFGDLYYGSAFVPEKLINHFCDGHHPEHRNELLALCSKIHQPPNPLGTIFAVQSSTALSEIFQIGIDAYKKHSEHGTVPSNIVETCVLMGYAATNSVACGRLDSRAFPIQNSKRMGRILMFHIDNPLEKPTEGKWAVGNRVKIDGNTGEHCAVIETVLAVKSSLKITVRLSKDVGNHLKFNDRLYIVSQREPMDMQILKNGFFEQTLPVGSHGRRILATLYGGAKLPKYHVSGKTYFYPIQSPIELNKYQAGYVEMLQNRSSHPIIVGSSPFGCGKSMTIVTAAVEVSKTITSDQKQLLITQSNFASVNLVDIARKIVENPSYNGDFKFVRYISEKNAKELAEDCLTDYDLPVLIKKIFEEWARGALQGNRNLEKRHKFNILSFVLVKNLVNPDDLRGEALRCYPMLHKRSISSYGVLDAFLILYNPNVIMTTADSLHTFLSFNLLSKDSVATIQIDEASQLPEYTFISLLTLFPNANYGLIGDIQQLPPYCETGLEGKLKDFGIGNTMERAVAENLFPQAMLREVYRCHPKTTDLLSELFYEGKLISGIGEDERINFMMKRPDFWPNPNFPVMVVNNRGKTQKMGTSCGNADEKIIIHELLKSLTKEINGYRLKESDIGVISFYKAQTSVLTDSLRGRGVKCGTVDAFQGTEREVIILCCTNQTISEFMQMSNRLNVAMSRAKQVTIIVGNVQGLKKAKYWKTIVERSEQYGCVVEANTIGKVVAENRPKYHCTILRPSRPVSHAQANHHRDQSDLAGQIRELSVSRNKPTATVPPTYSSSSYCRGAGTYRGPGDMRQSIQQKAIPNSTGYNQLNNNSSSSASYKAPKSSVASSTSNHQRVPSAGSTLTYSRSIRHPSTTNAHPSVTSPTSNYNRVCSASSSATYSGSSTRQFSTTKSPQTPHSETFARDGRSFTVPVEKPKTFLQSVLGFFGF